MVITAAVKRTKHEQRLPVESRVTSIDHRLTTKLMVGSFLRDCPVSTRSLPLSTKQPAYPDGGLVNSYTLIAFRPPHVSLASPEQSMLHVASPRRSGSSDVTPQKHCRVKAGKTGVEPVERGATLASGAWNLDHRHQMHEWKTSISTILVGSSRDDAQVRQHGRTENWVRYILGLPANQLNTAVRVTRMSNSPIVIPGSRNLRDGLRHTMTPRFCTTNDTSAVLTSVPNSVPKNAYPSQASAHAYSDSREGYQARRVSDGRT